MSGGRPKEYKARTTFTTSCELELYEEFKAIARRDGKDVNAMLQEYMAKVIKEHGAGNANFRMDNWVEDSSFKATPAILETNQKWYQHMANECDDKELRLLEGTFRTRLDQVKAIKSRRDSEAFLSRRKPITI